ncbi:MAG: hypothetical protein LUI02_01690, partial [Clostridiales bacterium]|nr:hypothetical protein [Clostridiales bacterium]
TYTITVTRAADGEDIGGGDEGDEEGGEDADEPDEGERYLNYYNSQAYPSAQLPSDVSEEGFEQGTVTLWGEEYECLVDTFSGEGYMLLWVDMMDEGEYVGDGLYLMLPDNQSDLYDYASFHAENTFVLALPKEAAPDELPDGYAWGGRTLSNGMSIDAIFWDGNSADEFGLVYCVSSQGVTDWYRLDMLDLTFIRYVQDEVAEEEPQEAAEETEPAEISTEEEAGEETGIGNHLMIGIVVIAVLIVVIVIILILIFRGRGSGSGGEDDDDDDLEFIDMQ